MDMGIYQKFQLIQQLHLGCLKLLVGPNECICNFLNDGMKVLPYGLEKLSLETGVVFRIEVYHRTPTVF